MKPAVAVEPVCAKCKLPLRLAPSVRQWSVLDGKLRAAEHITCPGAREEGKGEQEVAAG